ncbi:MAG: LysM peptidoglycan-binding domain-containing protein [Phycisphaerae bacterium]
MQRDLKIGLLVGLVIAGAAMLYICTRPSFSPKAQVLKAAQSPRPAESPQLEQQNLAIKELNRYTEPKENLQPALPQTTQSQEIKLAEPRPSFAEQKIQPEPADYTSTEKIKTTRFYIVRSGDTLSQISKNYYGSASQWSKIYQANRDVLGANPNLLKPGTKLIIPD